MCGRFVYRTNPREWAEILRIAREINFDWQPSYNIAPTQTVVCVRNVEEREFFQARWGLIPSWPKDPKIGAQCINARTETIAAKPAFRSAFKKKRCLVIADGFYEWETLNENQKPVKRPHYISLKSGHPMTFAGLWETWNSPDGLILAVQKRCAKFDRCFPITLTNRLNRKCSVDPFDSLRQAFVSNAPEAHQKCGRS